MSRELAHEMRTAADTLEAVSGLYDAANPPLYPWSAAELRREAEHVEQDTSL